MCKDPNDSVARRPDLSTLVRAEAQQKLRVAGAPVSQRRGQGLPQRPAAGPEALVPGRPGHELEPGEARPEAPRRAGPSFFP